MSIKNLSDNQLKDCQKQLEAELGEIIRELSDREVARELEKINDSSQIGTKSFILASWKVLRQGSNGWQIIFLAVLIFNSPLQRNSLREPI